jgi:hypothetical protein
MRYSRRTKEGGEDDLLASLFQIQVAFSKIRAVRVFVLSWPSALMSILVRDACSLKASTVTQVMGVALIADDLNAGAQWMEAQEGLVTWRSPLAASEYNPRVGHD